MVVTVFSAAGQVIFSPSGVDRVVQCAEGEPGVRSVQGGVWVKTEFRAAIDDARERIAAVLGPACPTAAFLVALRDEVERARAEPASVPYPELADPDAYWAATVGPQSRAVREAAVAIVHWLEERIITMIEGVESDLKALVDTAASDPGADPVTRRGAVEEEIAARCHDLHERMGEVLTVLPSFETIEEARRAGDESLRGRASDDVEGLKSAYLREAGGDENHQRFAAEQWAETFADRVAHRASMLAAQAPWRHQELALVGYERACAEVVRTVEATTARLQAPLVDLQRLLLERFDDAVPADA